MGWDIHRKEAKVKSFTGSIRPLLVTPHLLCHTTKLKPSLPNPFLTNFSAAHTSPFQSTLHTSQHSLMSFPLTPLGPSPLLTTEVPILQPGIKALDLFRPSHPQNLPLLIFSCLCQPPRTLWPLPLHLPKPHLSHCHLLLEAFPHDSCLP